MTQPQPLDFVFLVSLVVDLLVFVLLVVLLLLVVVVVVVILDDFTGVVGFEVWTKLVLIVGSDSISLLLGESFCCSSINNDVFFNRVELGDGIGVVCSELMVAFKMIWFISCSCFSFNFWTNSSASLANSPSGRNGLSFGSLQ